MAATAPQTARHRGRLTAMNAPTVLARTDDAVDDLSRPADEPRPETPAVALLRRWRQRRTA